MSPRPAPFGFAGRRPSYPNCRTGCAGSFWPAQMSLGLLHWERLDGNGVCSAQYPITARFKSLRIRGADLDLGIYPRLVRFLPEKHTCCSWTKVQYKDTTVHYGNDYGEEHFLPPRFISAMAVGTDVRRKKQKLASPLQVCPSSSRQEGAPT